MLGIVYNLGILVYFNGTNLSSAFQELGNFCGVKVNFAFILPPVSILALSQDPALYHVSVVHWGKT